MTDLYPFMRMGMFAEPVPRGEPIFQYEVARIKNGTWESLTQKETGIAPHVMNYLARNHHYRGEGGLLLQKLSKTSKGTLYLIEVNRENGEIETLQQWPIE